MCTQLAVYSPIHTAVCMRRSCANCPHPPQCESFRFVSQSVAMFSLHTSHTRTQQPRTHKLAAVSCSNGKSRGKVAVFKVEVQTLL